MNLDYAASAPALGAVADRAAELLPLYSSVHRGAGYASVVCTSAYEAARGEIASFVGARDGDVVVITRNTTDALNLLATAVGPVVYLDIEHHANLLPWQARRGRVVPARATLGETIAAIRAELACRPAAVLAVTGASNVTGECLPLAELAQVAHRYGARIAVDGAQLVPHRRIDMAAAGLDYLAFSGHKIYAPFGAGVLVGIGVRDGRFCAHPLLARLNPAGTAVRASLGLGSRADDVDRLITALTALADHGPAWTYAGAEQDYVPLPHPRALPGWLTAAAESRSHPAPVSDRTQPVEPAARR